MKRGFTVAEMLVVILIIVVLVALLFPAFSKGKAKASNTVCISNMRQLYAAMKLYQADFDEYPPNLASYSGFKPYYPTILLCPQSKHLSEPNLRPLDYRMVGQMVRKAPATEEAAQQAFFQCRQLRGPLMPLIVDQNHVPQLLDKSDRFSFYFVGREGGSVENVRLAKVLQDSGPCNTEFISAVYN